MSEREVQQFLERRENVRESSSWDPSSSSSPAAGMSELYAALERDLIVLGCTAVEDRLQEDVPQSLHFLREAGF